MSGPWAVKTVLRTERCPADKKFILQPEDEIVHVVFVNPVWQQPAEWILLIRGPDR